jgi:hypothetical protein
MIVSDLKEPVSEMAIDGNAGDVATDPSTRSGGRSDALDSGRAAFVEACVDLARSEESRIRDEIGERERELERISGQLRAVSRELHLSRRRLAGMELVTATDRERFERDYDGILALPHVKAVSVERRRIRILTTPIDISYEGASYRIGEFAIELDLEARTGVRILNLANTSQSTGWDHPHVQGGAPCLGNLQEGVQLLLGEMELVPLAALMIQFLETFNPTTAYGAIELWECVAS